MNFEAEILAQQIIEFFYARAGFDGFWDSLPKDIREEIKADLVDLLTP